MSATDVAEKREKQQIVPPLPFLPLFPPTFRSERPVSPIFSTIYSQRAEEKTLFASLNFIPTEMADKGEHYRKLIRSLVLNLPTTKNPLSLSPSDHG